MNKHLVVIERAQEGFNAYRYEGRDLIETTWYDVSMFETKTSHKKTIELFRKEGLNSESH